MSINIRQFFAIAIGLTLSTYATGAPMDASAVNALLTSKMVAATAALSSMAMMALGVFATLQIVITNIGLLKSGADIEAIIGKLIGSILWIAVCVYILQKGPGFISGVGNQFFTIPGLGLPTVGSIMANTGKTAGIIAVLLFPIGFASSSFGMLIVYLLLGILAIGCFFAFKIFMLQLELGLIIMLAPLSFAFLGLNALKDQGIAPFKSLISLIYRVILVGVILSAFKAVDASVQTAFNDFSATSIITSAGSLISTLVTAIGSYLLLAFLLYKSDSIAASLASGSTNMGTGDIAGAAAAGAAAGAAVAAGGAVLPEAAGKGKGGIADMMKKLSGNSSGPTVANAGPAGGGGPASPSPTMSTSLTTPVGAGGGPSNSAMADPKAGTAGVTGYAAGPANPGAAAAEAPAAKRDGVSPGVPSPAALPQESGAGAGAGAGVGTVGANPQGAPAVQPGGTGGAAQAAGAGTGLITPVEGGDYAAALGGGQGPGSNTEHQAKKPEANAVPESAANAHDPHPSSSLQRPDSASGGGLGGGASQQSHQSHQLDKTLGALVQQLDKMSAPKKPGLWSEVGKVNQHVAQEKATTNVSISTHSE